MLLRFKIPNWLIIFLFFCLILLINILLSSCNPQKKIEKSIMTVLTNKSAFDTIGKKYLELNPCINEIKYKSDTTEIHDTTNNFYHYTDTLNKIDTVVRTIKTIKLIHDTATIIDGQQVKLLSETIINKDLQIATMNGQIIAANNATKEAQGETTKWRLYFFSLLSFIGIVSILKIIAAVSPSSSTANLLKKLKL